MSSSLPRRGRRTRCMAASSLSATPPRTASPSPSGPIAIGGLLRRPVHPAHRRDRRRAPHPLLLDGELGPRNQHHRADDQGPPRRARQPAPRRPRRGRRRRRPRPRAGRRFTLPATQGAGRLPTHQRRSGITPVMAILRTLCRHGHTGPVTFLHYSHTEAGMIYRDELASIAAAHPNVRVVRSFTTEPGRGEVDGPPTVEQLSTIEPSGARRRRVCVRACSPDGRRHRAVRAGWRHGPLPHGSVHTAAVRRRSRAVSGTLRLGATGRDVENDGRRILLQAEAAGLAPASGCRMGPPPAPARWPAARPRHRHRRIPTGTGVDIGCA